jgi:GntR family transcriptional regulator, transcriptional repressor for pyruvate dehydrogenase complex
MNDPSRRGLMKKRTSDIVIKKITENILDGVWLPGMKITGETQLAKELEVSRISVREAIERLSSLNVLTKKHGGGTYVNKLQPSLFFNTLIPMITLAKDDYIEILEFRLIFEAESVRLCVERGTDEIIGRIEKSYKMMVAHKDDCENFTNADLEFHTAITEGTGNSLLIKLSEVLHDILQYHQRKLYKELGPAGGVIEHKEILDAIKDRDAELASINMKKHILRAISEFRKRK